MKETPQQDPIDTARLALFSTRKGHATWIVQILGPGGSPRWTIVEIVRVLGHSPGSKQPGYVGSHMTCYLELADLA